MSGLSESQKTELYELVPPSMFHPRGGNGLRLDLIDFIERVDSRQARRAEARIEELCNLIEDALDESDRTATRFSRDPEGLLVDKIRVILEGRGFLS